MNNLTYTFRESNVRVEMVDNEPWFAAKDVCDILELSNPTVSVGRLEEDERTKLNLGRQGETNFVNEYGLYNLIFGSRKPEAKEFKRWVTHEVLPAIRKTGSYQKPLTEKEQLEVMMKHTLLQSEETKALKSEVERVASDVEDLKNNTRIDSYQETQLARMVNVSVFTALGGKESNAYTELGKTTFVACNSEFKKYFHIPRRGELPRIKFDEACEFIGSWKPSTALSMDIKKCNSQQTLDWLENL